MAELAARRALRKEEHAEESAPAVKPERKTIESTTTDAAAALIERPPTDGRGRGVVTRRALRRGEIVRELPMVYSTGTSPVVPMPTHPWALTHAIMGRPDAARVWERFADDAFERALPVWDADDVRAQRHLAQVHKRPPAEVKRGYAAVAARNLESHVCVEVAPGRAEMRTVGFGFYELFGFLNHSCEPAVDLISMDVATGVKGLRVLRDLAEGEEVTMAYICEPLEEKMATPERRAMLKSRFGFDCLCSRCLRETVASSAAATTTVPAGATTAALGAAE